MNPNKFIYLDECPICRQGTLLAAKDKTTQKYLVICDDCLLLWINPSSAKKCLPPLSLDLQAKEVLPITKQELEEIGWDKYIERPFK